MARIPDAEIDRLERAVNLVVEAPNLRFDNEWVRGPAHGRAAAEGYAYEWDVQLSPRGARQWGQNAKRGVGGQPYLNVTPQGRLSH